MCDACEVNTCFFVANVAASRFYGQHGNKGFNPMVFSHCSNFAANDAIDIMISISRYNCGA